MAFCHYFRVTEDTADFVNFCSNKIVNYLIILSEIWLWWKHFPEKTADYDFSSITIHFHNDLIWFLMANLTTM